MKKSILVFFTCILLCVVPISANASPNISASSACVMDAASGRILYEKDAFTMRGMASTTKIMTAIVALEQASLEEEITVSANAANTEGSSIWLETGEKMKLEDLLYGLLLASGNDAAVAIAEGVGGDVDSFVAMMNEKAKEIGAVNTSFENPNGLTAEHHYTTAYDLALITRYAMKNEVFREIVATKTKTIPWESSEWDRSLKNHNKLLDRYEGCDGVKTGYTKACGRCLVSSATKDGVRLICVTLNDPNDWEDHRVLLDNAFQSYPATVLIEKGQNMKEISIKECETEISLIAEEGITLPLSLEEKERVSFEIKAAEIELPVMAGEKMGEVNVLLDGVLIAQTSLVTDKEYQPIPKEKSVFEKFNELIKLFLQGNI